MRLTDVNIAITGGAQGIGRGIAPPSGVGRGARHGRGHQQGWCPIRGRRDRSGWRPGGRDPCRRHRQGQSCERRQHDGIGLRISGCDVQQCRSQPAPALLEITEEVYSRIMDVNALGVLLGTQEAAKQMVSQGRGGRS